MAQTKGILPEPITKVKRGVTIRLAPTPPGTVTIIGTRSAPKQLKYYAASEADARWWFEMLPEAGFDYSIDAVAVWDEMA